MQANAMDKATENTFVLRIPVPRRNVLRSDTSAVVGPLRALLVERDVTIALLEDERDISSASTPVETVLRGMFL